MTNQPACNSYASTGKRLGPTMMIIFGAAGDLTKRKLLPAIFNLENASLLPESFTILGISRGELDTQSYRLLLDQNRHQFLPEGFDQGRWQALLERTHYLRGDFEDPRLYARLLELVAELFHQNQSLLYYLATPPEHFSTIVEHLSEAKLLTESESYWRRVVFEKPFGQDLESAQALNRSIGEVLDESQIYRIDHYLGKETVQNLLVFRFANGIFEPIWNRRYIDNVQITVAEELGVAGRANYYDRAGALRDMVPNHLFQLLALTAMEPPSSFDADAVRNEKVKVLQAIQPITPEQVLQRTVRGQYDRGVIEGEEVRPYRLEPRVAANSNTETYAALKLCIDNWRWAGVPFYLRTGKRLEKRLTQIVIQFGRAPFHLFSQTPIDHVDPNMLIIRIQPREGISLRFGAKKPGTTLCVGNVDMEFCYSSYFGGTPATGYETLIHDCLRGDATLFQRADSVEAGWRVIQPLLDVWSALPARSFPNYTAGCWGPTDANRLLGRDGREWKNPR